MQKYLLSLTVAALTLALPAHAGYISLNTGVTGGPTFTPLPGNSVQVTGDVGPGPIAGYETAAECGAGCLETASASSDTNFTGQLISNYNYTTSGTGGFSFRGTIYDPNGSGTVIAVDQLAATISWNSFYFPNYGVGATLFGTGVVTSSSGDDVFEADFPLGGAFNITVDLRCGGRVMPSCLPDQPVGTTLDNGTLIPTPSPLVGKPGWPLLLCLAVLGLVRRYRNGANQAKAGRAASLFWPRVPSVWF